jgi:hypothetical protein
LKIENWNEFLSDPDVLFLTNHYGQQNIFDILDPKEQQYSNLLAWLLDPRSGHGLGDYFIKALLLTAWNKAVEKNLQLEVFGEKNGISPTNINSWDFGSSIVECEFQLAKGPIDVFLVDPVNEIQIFIENKAGSKEGADQTLEYRRSANKFKKTKGSWWHQIFIFIDLYESEAKDKEWVSIGYDWISESIDSCLNNHTVNINSQYVLEQIQDYLVGTNSFTDVLYKVKIEHQDIISELANRTNKLTGSELESLLEPDQPGMDRRIFCLKHWRLICALSDLNRWDHLISKFINKYGDDFEYESHSHRSKSTLYVRRKIWHKYNSPDIGEWAITIALRDNNGNIEHRFYIHSDLLDEALQSKSASLADTYFEEEGKKIFKDHGLRYFKESVGILTDEEYISLLFSSVKRMDAALAKVFPIE